MNISDNIRALAHEGLSTTEIARRLEIRYQHAYNVLKAGGKIPTASIIARATTTGGSSRALAPPKPSLTVDQLVAGGFVLSGRWILSDAGDLVPDRLLPKVVGVYAFAKDGIALYVGLATIGLAKRLYFYGKPGVTQPTSQRLNGIIKNELLTIPYVDIYTAIPPDLEWSGLPVHGSAGVELGLIKKYSLPWNMRSAG
jgi:hypothetical protein